MHSCDNPIPVVGHKLSIRSSKSIVNPELSTDSEGRFALPYELDYRQLDHIVLRDENVDYLIGIPKKENIDVGDIYLKDNYFAFLQLSVNRPTSESDTVFYDWWGYKRVGSKSVKNYRKFKVGPFTDDQILDTIVFRDIAVYDSIIYNIDNYPGYRYKIGEDGADLVGWGPEGETKLRQCHRYNIYNLTIE